MQEIKLFGFVIRPDNGKTWAVSEILTTSDKGKEENIGKEYEGNTRYPRDLECALLMIRQKLLRKKDIQSLDDYIKVIKQIDDDIVKELKSLLP